MFCSSLASSPWHKTECSNVDFAKRLLVLEEFDGANVYRPAKTEALMKEIYGPSMRWYFMYFKRSFVHRRDGVFKDYPALSTRDIFPMVYSIGNSYSQLDFNHNRSIDITCTLRGNKQMTTRLRVQTWVAEYVNNSANRVSNAVLKELNHDTRTKISKGYFDKMFNSKIIVTVNPANWEGDFRLWESMASGALVMVDPLFVPYPHPLVDGKHVVFYDNHNKTDFMTKLDYYHKNPAEARKIAVAGYLFCMKYHRTSSMMDYFLRSAHIRMLQNSGVEERLLPKYRYTAQYLMNATQRQHHLIRKHKRPGVYEH